MTVNEIPFNISLLQLSDELTQGLREVKSLDIFDTTKVNFHDDGLFSTTTFGKVGTDRRSRAFAYIDIKIPVIHPLIFKTITDIHAFYGEIMSGKGYAIWNPATSDFERSNSPDAQTGYQFFISHWEDLKFEETGSPNRMDKIANLNKYRKQALNTKVVVFPAGLRDAEVIDGRIQEDEINPLYRRLISIANTISDANLKHPESVDPSRWSLQRAFNDLYQYLYDMIDGKKKLILAKWASRRVFNTTRNVLTAMPAKYRSLHGRGEVSYNNTIVGIYQAMKCILPVSLHRLRNGFLSKIFLDPSLPAVLVDPKTMKRVEVKVKTHHYDTWTTDEGLEQIMNLFSDPEVRHDPVTIEGKYLSLTYAGPDGTFRFVSGIDQLPEDRLAKDCHPTTLAELFYGSIYKALYRYPLFPTRYPITGLGSIYPSIMYTMTTVKAEVRRELTESWEVDQSDPAAWQWPIVGEPFITTLIPHTAHIGAMGGDHDGDTGSGSASYSDESVKEVEDFFKLKRAYVGPTGKIMASNNYDTAVFVIKNFSGA